MKDKTIITIVLTVAATALIGFGIFSFTNYQQAKFEKEFDAKQEAQVGSTSPEAPEVAPVPNVPAPIAPVAATPPAYLPPATESEVFGSASVAPDNRSPAAIAAAESRARFEEMRKKEDALMREVQGRGNSTAPAAGTQSEFSSGASDPEQSILGEGPSQFGPVDVMPIPAQASPPKLSAFQEQIQSEAAIASVTHYDEGMNFLVVSGGQDRNIESGDKFAVRRGTEIVGYVKVQEVMVNESIATLVSKNRDSVTAVKPQVGDDLISFDRFAF